MPTVWAGAQSVLNRGIAVRDLLHRRQRCAQANTANARCVYFLGGAGCYHIQRGRLGTCRSDAVTLNGNQAPFDATAPFAAGSRLAFIDNLYINGAVGAPGGNGWGLGLQNRFRAGMVSNVYVENAQGTGLS